MYVRVSVGKKSLFFGKYGVLCSFFTSEYGYSPIRHEDNRIPKFIQFMMQMTKLIRSYFPCKDLLRIFTDNQTKTNGDKCKKIVIVKSC